MSTLFDEIWPAFYAEVSEQLDELEVLLSSSAVGSLDVGHIFRLFHTIKSSTAMMEFKDMELLAHTAEDILDLVRDGKTAMSEQICDLMVAVAGQLKGQLQEANKTRVSPAGDTALLEQTRQMLVALGGTVQMEFAATADAPKSDSLADHEVEPKAPEVDESIDPIFAAFAAALDVQLPALARWLADQVARKPSEVKRLADACEIAGFPGLQSMATQMGACSGSERWLAAADFVHRLDTLRSRSRMDCGVDKLAAKVRPALLDSLHSLAAQALETPGLEQAKVAPKDLDVLLNITRDLGALVRLSGFTSLAFLLRFVEQILREVSRDNLLLPGELSELMMSAYSLCLEVEAEHGEDEAFAEICGRVLTTLQEIARNADAQEEVPDARDTLMTDFDIPFSLLTTLHTGSLPRMAEFCEQKVLLLDIEVDMDGPDEVRDSFISIIAQHGEVLSNRTIFASEKPGDLSVETTRLSIIAACTGDASAMVPSLLAYHSDHFHLSVQPVLYRGSPEFDSATAVALEAVVPSVEQAPLVAEASVAEAPVVDKSVEVPAAESTEGAAGSSDTLRVSSDRLDQFVTRIGELALLRNQMEHHLRGDHAEAVLARLHGFTQQLSAGLTLSSKEQRDLAECLEEITGQFDRLGQADGLMQQSLGLLQSSALDLRVVPVDTIFRRVPVLLRRLARQLGKEVHLVMEGKDTRIDKSMVDVLSEPLTHMVRNALDHGIETPAERRAAGKSETSLLTLRASQQGGSLMIELIDDGRGLDEKRICDRAIERGLISAEQATNLSRDKVQAMIFEPGFSTAGAVTETSGRGVGMDIVRTRVEQLGGEIAIRSTPGQGCRIALHLPLSAAIQGIILFACGDEVYGLAERSINEAIDVRAEELQCIQGQMAIMHRNHALPVYTLSHIFGQSEVARLEQDATLPVLLVSDGRRQIGILVEQINSRQEIFVRECHPDIASLPGVSGASVLGNGDPVLILEASGLIDLAALTAQEMVALLEAS